MNDNLFSNDEFGVIIASKEDFTVNDDYNKANDSQKAYIWEYARRKMSDMIMQDFWDALDVCVDFGLEYYKEEQKNE